MIEGLEYLIKDKRGYLSLVKEGSSGTLVLSFPTLDEGWLTLDGKNYKISHGSASVPISRLRDGVHPVSLDTSEGRIELYPIRVQSGAITLDTGAHTLAHTERELYALATLTEKLTELTARLDVAVFGTKIF